jgi:glucokinase
VRFLATGGVYIAGGGIAGKLFERIQRGDLVKNAYLSQGPASDLVGSCPLFLARTSEMGMRGCRAVALEQLPIRPTHVD